MTPRIMFKQELEELRTDLTEMGQRAENGYDKLVCAVIAKDTEVLTGLLDSDRQIVGMQRNIEAKCLYLMTKEQPVAGDLRMISAALKVVTDIERIGDHVTDIAELFLRMGRDREADIYEKLLHTMMEETKEMLHRAVEAFVDGNAEQADLVIAQDDVIDELFNEVKMALMEAIQAQTLDADSIVDYLMVAKYLEKIGDHAVNIGEWTKFQKTGDMQGYPLY